MVDDSFGEVRYDGVGIDDFEEMLMDWGFTSATLEKRMRCG